MTATATAQVTVKACVCALVVAFADNGEELTTGCNATTKRTFAPGHDARLKGFLIRAGIAGHLVRVGEDANTDAQAVADQFGFGYMVREGIRKGAEREFRRELRRVAKAAKAPAPQKVTAKVGRWQYEGTLSADGTEFAYTDRRGNQVTTTKFARV